MQQELRYFGDYNACSRWENEIISWVLSETLGKAKGRRDFFAVTSSLLDFSELDQLCSKTQSPLHSGSKCQGWPFWWEMWDHLLILTRKEATGPAAPWASSFRPSQQSHLVKQMRLKVFCLYQLRRLETRRETYWIKRNAKLVGWLYKSSTLPWNHFIFFPGSSLCFIC